MDFHETALLAAKGDASAALLLYTHFYKELYYIAFLSLGEENAAVSAVKTAAEICLSSCGECRNEASFRAYFIRILCEQIISAFRSQRKSGFVYIEEGNQIKDSLMKLTEAERLSVIVYSLCDYNERQISIVTGLKPEAVETKLQSAKNKLSSLEEALYL